MSFWIMGLKRSASRKGEPKGQCAGCAKDVYESLLTLDDCYNVYAGKCPYCGVINLLDTSKGRGYSTKAIFLVLPTTEERDHPSNGLPPDCAVRS